MSLNETVEKGGSQEYYETFISEVSKHKGGTCNNMHSGAIANIDWD